MSPPVDSRERLESRIEAGLAERLPGFLVRQRWFGAKARAIAGAEMEDLAWLGDGSTAPVLAITRVRFADGGVGRYALLLGLDDREGDPGVIGPLPPPGEPLWMCEAATRPGVVLAFLRSIPDGAALPTRQGGRVVHGDTLGSAGRSFDPGALDPGSVRAIGAEQSNTSLRLGSAHVFKLFRKLEPGENPELEVARFLTARTSFTAMAALRGSWSYEPPGGGHTTLGIVQDWVENRGDGWGHVLASLADIYGAGADPGPLLEDLRGLGTLTAEFHLAVAGRADDPDFAPRPIGLDDVTRWRAALAAQAERALGLLERGLDGLDEPGRALARKVLATSVRRIPPAARDASAETSFLAIRVHGDYHLGQTLKTAGGFTIIDFEGEPARPLAERRAKQCALKDVTGMLRSFDYAIETARAGPPRSGAPGADPPLRESFLDAYRARAAGAAFLPARKPDLEAWMDFFELDKALYEVEYELNHRPAWVNIPLRGIARILERPE